MRNILYPWRALMAWLRAPSRWSAFVVTFVASLFVGAGVAGYLSRSVPVSVKDVHELDGVASRGGTIDLVAKVVKRIDCDTKVDRWLWRPHPLPNDPDAREYHYLPGAPAYPPIPPGPVQYVLVIPVPTDVAEGTDWHYQGVAHDHCAFFPFLAAPTRYSPDIPIPIQKASPSNPAAVSIPSPGSVLLLPETAVEAHP